MKELTKEDIQKNSVDTISQYKILDYLKRNLNIYEFQVYLVDPDNIKILDKENKHLYFNYNSSTKEIIARLLNLALARYLEQEEKSHAFFFQNIQDCSFASLLILCSSETCWAGPEQPTWLLAILIF